MKKVLFLSVFFLLFGCKSGVDYSMELSYYRLSKQPYFYSDSCYEENVEYRFYKNSYEKIFYQSSEFKKVIKRKSGPIKYLNMLQVELQEDNNIFDCTVGEDEGDSLVFVCLNRAANSPYSKVMTLWKSKALAKENKDYDCDPYN